MKARGKGLGYGTAQAVDKYLTGKADDAAWHWAWAHPDQASRAMRRALKSAARKAQKQRSKA